jgi:hypothetical protein
MPDRTTLQTCEICEHCWPIIEQHTDERFAGDCRRFPPVTQALPRPDGGITLTPFFPRVRKGIGCGEFRLRERVGQ